MLKKNKKKNDITALQNYATLTSRKNNKNRLFLMKDMMKCYKLYGCHYEEYYYNRFDLLTDKQRETYVTEEKNQLLVKEFNKQGTSFQEKKTTYYQALKNDLKRDYLYLTGENLDEFIVFSEKHPVFIAKTDERKDINQIRRVVLNEHMKPDKVYESLLEKNLNLLEEERIQHPVMKELYPKALNTVEFITIKHKGKVHITSCVLKIGNGSIVNNVYYGGMVAGVDLKTGVVNTPGVDYRDHVYETHPSTKVKIQGFEIPDFQKLKQYVLSLALKLKQANYVSFDIALLEDGFAFIDLSLQPTWYQFPPFVPDKIGKLPQIEQVLGHQIEIKKRA